MAGLKPNWWKIVITVFVPVLVDVILHRLFAPRVDYNFPPSIFVEKGLFLPAVVIALVIMFGVLAIIFAFIQRNLPGTKGGKGLRYGISFGVLCFLSIIEMSLVFDSPLADELRTSTIDGISLLLLGLFLGKLTATPHQVDNRRSPVEGMSLVLIPLTFFVGRYFGYTIVHIPSAYYEKPSATFLWTLGIGVWIAFMYWLLKEEQSGRTAIVQALRFGGLVFGVFWLIYNSFVLLFLKVSVANVFVRVCIDTLFVTASIWVVNKLSQRAGKTSAVG